MAKYKKSGKTGAPPGTLIYTGSKQGDIRFTAFSYDTEHCAETHPQSVEECLKLKDVSGTTWLNVDGLNQPELIGKLGEGYNLHPLVQEDILHVGQRPKVENYQEYLYVVIRMLTYNEDAQQIESEQVSLVLGDGFVISFQERDGDVFEPVRERIRNSKGRIRKMGADYLLYALLDAVVDHYFTVLERFGDSIEQVENAMVEDISNAMLREIHHLKRALLDLRKSVWPLREAVNGLYRGDSHLVTETTQIYLRDVYDHTIQVMDTVEIFRDIVSGMLDLYLSSVGNRTNDVMKVLTIMASIFIPLTFIAGLYGMNFANMPELNKPWGYPAVLAVMAVISVAMLAYFRRKKWI